MSTRFVDSPGDRDARPVPMGYEIPAAYRAPGAMPGMRSPRPAVPPPRPPGPPPAAVTPGPLFGVTVAGLFVLLGIAVVAVVEIVGR